MDTNTTNEFRCPDGQSNSEICTTTLVSSSFVNVSSLSLGSGIPTNRPRLTQKVIGCSMLRSTDHFRGTALRDMNMGGNVLCSNSSFAHCSSASDQNITQDGRLSWGDVNAGTQTFTSCTFRHMTCTTSNFVGGAAIALDQTQANLTISLCAFHNCTATGDDACGGAVCFVGRGETASPASTVTISQSSITDCSAQNGGGAVMVLNISSLSLDTCFFGGNSALAGGAFMYANISSLSVSNSSFVDNVASVVGGAAYSESPSSIVFTDVLFRDNVGPSGSDMVLMTKSEAIAANVTRCDSSSAIPTLIYTDGSSFFETDSTLLKQVTPGFLLSSCSVSHSGTESTVTIKTVNAVNGVMSVLLSGGLVPRLVSVPFGSTGSTTGTGTTTTDVLPSTNEYSLEAAVLAGYRLESQLAGADASLITPNTTKIDLKGMKLVSGSYSMIVEDASGTPTIISLTLLGSTTLSTTVSLYPIDSAELKYGTKYTVISVLRDTTSLAVKDGLSFTTPDEPARIVGIWAELDSSGNMTLVTLRGRQIVTGSYTVRLNSESGPSFSISFSDGVSDERNSSVATVPIFGDSPILSFGTTYTLFSVVPTSSPSTPLLIDPNPNSFLISEPSRLVSISPVLAASLETVTLTFGGRSFDVGSFTVKLFVTSPTLGIPFDVACSTVSETELTLILPISSHDLSNVEFGDVLSVLSLKNGSSSAILEMSTFSIPHPPRVDTASFSFCSDLNTTFSVTLRGTDLPSHERFVVVLDSSHSFEVVITNSCSGTSAEMAIGWTDSLQYDTEYRIVSIRNEETGRNVFIDSPSFCSPFRFGLFRNES
ncbi:hypothetical protein BLNAU_11244 [Blattamonas nauphoetae]|uniref:Uncharacterized protein n=1 Tax=Blattamonas nauphoetae TaxID=2049346 RepID=A0ABQ9XN44_9EUKA|nr:hypothetical protein BLNAU_11244 [Blattamonas nauphoetae]